MKNYKLVLHPREFNRLVELGLIESQYIINPEIDNEKDDLYERITELESIVKDAFKIIEQDHIGQEGDRFLNRPDVKEIKERE